MVDEDPSRTGRNLANSIAAELEVESFEDPFEIGRCGFGIVYRCNQAASNEVVAVKLLPTEFYPDSQSRFMGEQRGIGGLTAHQNIVTVLAVDTNARLFACGDYCSLASCGVSSLIFVGRLGVLGLAGHESLSRAGQLTGVMSTGRSAPSQ